MELFDGLVWLETSGGKDTGHDIERQPPMVNGHTARRVARVAELVLLAFGPWHAQGVLVKWQPEVVVGGNAMLQDGERVDGGFRLVHPELRGTQQRDAHPEAVAEERKEKEREKQFVTHEGSSIVAIDGVKRRDATFRPPSAD